jgi:hypothetical protein
MKAGRSVRGKNQLSRDKKNQAKKDARNQNDPNKKSK